MDIIDTLYFAVPCFNEEEVLPETARRLTEKLTFLINTQRVSEQSRILFIDDGSRDATWRIITALREDNPLIGGVKLSRNCGHQNALLAGLMTAREHADMVISLDADLQDDIAVVDGFIDKYYEGCDIVYGVRASRKTDTAFKRSTAGGFYRLMSRLGVELVYNHADYRLMSRRAIDALADFKEVNLFLRGIVPLIGFKSDTVEYDRAERFAGTSKYPLKKMLSFAWQGVTSFSVKPIRFICALGVILFALGIAALITFLIIYLCCGLYSGVAVIAASIWTAAGLQTAAIGVVGEYVGKIYTETKARPRYIIEDIII